MPFVKSIKVENGVLGLWKLSENSKELINIFQFSQAEKQEFSKFTGERRKTEYLATRLLLQKLFNQKTEITHINSGKPQILNSNLNISISHSADYVAVYVSEVKNGIDVENQFRKIDKVVPRFLNKNELDWIEKSNKSQFLKIMLWCAKEAIFKCSEQSGVQFNEQIFIDLFDFEKTNCFYGTLVAQNCKENYLLRYFNIQNNIVVYCVEEHKNSI